MALDEALPTEPRIGRRKHWLIAIVGAAIVGILAPMSSGILGISISRLTSAEIWLGLVGVVATAVLLIVRRRSRLLPYAVGLIILPVASFIGLVIAAIIATHNSGG